MAYKTGWYTNSRGKRVYGKHSTSPGYYNKAGKWVVGKKKTTKPQSHNGEGGSDPRPDPHGPRPPAPTARARETKNANPRAHGLFKASASRLQDGDGYSASVTTPKGRQLNFNLENNEDVAQGSQTEWSHPTSISNLISGQLRQASNAPLDAWEAWAANNGGRVDVSMGDNPFQATMNYAEGDQAQANPASQLSNSQPMGAFGTSNVMYQYGLPPSDQQQQVEGGSFAGWQPDRTTMMGMSDADYFAKYGTPRSVLTDSDRADWMRMDPVGYKAALAAAQKAETDAISVFNKNFPNSTSVYKDSQAGAAYTKAYQGAYATFFNKTNATTNPQNILGPAGTFIPNPKYVGTIPAPTGPGTDGSAPAQSTIPNYTPGELGVGQTSSSADEDVFGQASSGLYNPWGRMQGAQNNQYGPSQQTMTNATMESMEMAKAYFAPQRAELAYELGDMETDMRRLAVNLGRQVDDPVLQAKLYKEGMRSVRTLDIQQNTFAFQMADARRKEENQNFQFYDQLAQEEARMKIANRQYYSTLELQKRQYNLQNWAAQNPSGVTATTSEQQQSQYGGGALATRKIT